MMMKIKYSALMHVLLLTLCFVVGFTLTDGIEFKDFDKILTTLQNVSASVFTLSGIWIAYSYPEAIAIFTNPDTLDLIKGSEHAKRIRSLVMTIFISALVLVFVMCINLAQPYAEHLLYNTPYHLTVRNISIGLINYMSILQIIAIGGIMANNLEFVYSLMKVKADNEIHDDLSK